MVEVRSQRKHHCSVCGRPSYDDLAIASMRRCRFNARVSAHRFVRGRCVAPSADARADLRCDFGRATGRGLRRAARGEDFAVRRAGLVRCPIPATVRAQEQRFRTASSKGSAAFIKCFDARPWHDLHCTAIAAPTNPSRRPTSPPRRFRHPGTASRLPPARGPESGGRDLTRLRQGPQRGRGVTPSFLASSQQGTPHHSVRCWNLWTSGRQRDGTNWADRVTERTSFPR